MDRVEDAGLDSRWVRFRTTRSVPTRSQRHARDGSPVGGCCRWSVVAALICVGLVATSCSLEDAEAEGPDGGPFVPPTLVGEGEQTEDPYVPGLDSANADDRNPYGWFEAERSWWGDFGDPFIMWDKDRGRYVAYASSSAGRYLPVTTSSDLITWFAISRWTDSPPPWQGGPDPMSDPKIPEEIRTSDLRLGPPGDVWNHNDGLVSPASWGLDTPNGPWLRRTIWAPSVAHIGGRWVLYYAVKISAQSDDVNGDGRFCISMATASSSVGPFRDTSDGPLICDDDPAGSIDPEAFYDPSSDRWYLLWKSAGKVGSHPSALKSIPLDDSGQPMRGHQAVTLLTTDESSWEGETIENPSMAHWDNRYILVYSGNAWRADVNGMSRYATGWAICPEGPRSACVRGSSSPLLVSDGNEQGPGGGSLLVGPDDRLFLSYCAFEAMEARNPRPRRLRVVEIVTDGNGSLSTVPIRAQ